MARSNKVDTESVGYKFAQKIQAELKRQGMKKKDLVEASGLDRKTVYNILNGREAYFSNMLIVAETLNLTLNDLYPDDIMESMNIDAEIMHLFRMLNPEKKDAAKEAVRAMLKAMQ